MLIDYIGKELELKEFPNSYSFDKGSTHLTLGKKYKINGIDGSNFIIDDDINDSISLGSCRFNLGLNKC